MPLEIPRPEQPNQRSEQKITGSEGAEKRPNVGIRVIPGTNVEVMVSDPYRSGGAELHLWEQQPEGKPRLIKGMGIEFPDGKAGEPTTEEQAEKILSLFELGAKLGTTPDRVFDFIDQIGQDRFNENMARWKEKYKKETP